MTGQKIKIGIVPPDLGRLGAMHSQCDNLCGMTAVVYGTYGGIIRLPVENAGIDDITWIHNNNRIASTGPQKTIHVTSLYNGKLESDQNGSLVIKNLRQEDEGTYEASIKFQDGNMCTVTYKLRVYRKLSVDDLKIELNVHSHELCQMTLNCTGSGSDVTITWICGGMNVTRNTVNVTDPQTPYTCTAQNPISGASKSITPGTYCENANRSGTGIGLGISFGIGIIITTIAITSYLIFKRKRRCLVHLQPPHLNERAPSGDQTTPNSNLGDKIVGASYLLRQWAPSEAFQVAECKDHMESMV
ncbi:SLAM family member 5-like [Leptodactylus fuscus]|uniref:SLAM family member 5-like n=1 Tax=Leptodactylus fuscus TaxID=238119 RepID=UPI003F4E7407